METVTIRLPRDVAERFAKPSCKQNRHLMAACQQATSRPRTRWRAITDYLRWAWGQRVPAPPQGLLEAGR